MSARRTSLAAALAALALAATPAPGAAQSSKADAFAGKIPPVSGQLYQKAGRFELTGTANLSLNDAFYTKYFGGAKATYHFTEHWAAGLHAAGGAAVQTSSAVGAEGAWSPVYGKLNVFSEQAAHFDLSILAGPDVIAYDEVLSKEEAAVKSPGVATSFGGHLGLGMRLFFTRAFALRLEVKDYIYAVNVPNGGIGNDVQNQLFAEIGVSYFFAGRSGPNR
jgi:outer membrane beta-barrel protein